MGCWGSKSVEVKKADESINTPLASPSPTSTTTSQQTTPATQANQVDIDVEIRDSSVKKELFPDDPPPTTPDDLYSYTSDELIERLKREGVGDAEELGTDKETLVAALREQLDTPKVLLVVGECGVGKSKLVSALRDETLDKQEIRSAGGQAGITKTITSYIGKRVKGRAIKILDTPGIGDKKVKAPELLTMIQDILASGKEMIHGVIVCTPITDGRVRTGGQIVNGIVNEAFFCEAGDDKWDSIILCGTHLDSARLTKPETIECFKMPITDDDGNKNVDEDGELIGVVADFFKDAHEGWGKYAMVDHTDYSKLIEEIAFLPNESIGYKELSAVELSGVVAKVTGEDKDVLRKQFEEDLKKSLDKREDEMRKEYERQRQEDAEKQRVEVKRVQEELNNISKAFGEAEHKADEERVRLQIKLKVAQEQQVGPSAALLILRLLPLH